MYSKKVHDTIQRILENTGVQNPQIQHPQQQPEEIPETLKDAIEIDAKEKVKIYDNNLEKLKRRIIIKSK